jgi:hypothetical protein
MSMDSLGISKYHAQLIGYVNLPRVQAFYLGYLMYINQSWLRSVALDLWCPYDRFLQSELYNLFKIGVKTAEEENK